MNPLLPLMELQPRRIALTTTLVLPEQLHKKQQAPQSPTELRSYKFWTLVVLLPSRNPPFHPENETRTPISGTDLHPF
jgi:hypothetical protein